MDDSAHRSRKGHRITRTLYQQVLWPIVRRHGHLLGGKINLRVGRVFQLPGCNVSDDSHDSAFPVGKDRSANRVLCGPEAPSKGLTQHGDLWRVLNVTRIDLTTQPESNAE